MKTALLYPLDLISFWYREVCIGTIETFVKFNSYLLNLFSVPLLLKTFFKPLKNEYRKGLVLFSIVFGIFLKSILVGISLSILLVFLSVELIITVGLFAFPILLIYIAYAGQNIF